VEEIMKRYAVSLMGRNYLFSTNGEPRKVGFSVTKYLKAQDPSEAERIARILVHKDPYLRTAIINEGTDQPVLDLRGVEELGWLRFQLRKSRSGFVFHDEEEVPSTGTGS